MAGIGLFGRVGEFSPEQETFCSYVERMEMFFMANNIIEEIKQARVKRKPISQLQIENVLSF